MKLINSVWWHSPLMAQYYSKKKAKEFVKLFDIDFHPDTFWIQRFWKRHNIVLGHFRSKSSSGPWANKEKWVTTRWPQIREKGYFDDEIFNANETGLCFKLKAEKIFKFKGERSLINSSLAVYIFMNFRREMLGWLIIQRKNHCHGVLQHVRDC